MEAPNLWSRSVPKSGTTINTSRRLLSLVMSKHCVVAFVSSPAPRSPPPSNAFRIACDGQICAVLSGEARSSPVTDYYRTMAEIRPIEPRKISNKSIANDRHGGILRLFFFFGEILPGPDLEKGIPRSSTQTDAVVADSQAAHAVLVAAQGANLVTTKDIPHLISRR